MSHENHEHRIEALEKAIGPALENEAHLPPLLDRTRLLEGRYQSFQSSELAYRQATSSIEKMRSEFADEHARWREDVADQNKKTLDAATTILESSVGKVLEPVTPVLDELRTINEEQSVIIKEVREEQIERTGREKQKADDAAADAFDADILAKKEAKAELARKESREFFIKIATVSAAILVPICSALGAYFAMRGH